MQRIGALEAGGTKMVMAIYNDAGERLDCSIIPTKNPSTTMPLIQKYFSGHKIASLGIASFGPLDLNKQSSTYGYITSSPKLEWADFPLLPELMKSLVVPIGFDTDVNAAVLAEVELGVAIDCDVAVYVTVGTGIGGGIVVDGKPIHGMLHPELGHMLLRPHKDDNFAIGFCPFHDGCLEGLASGFALAKRSPNNDARNLLDDDLILKLEAHYLAQMCANIITMISPQVIIIGGGVMQRGSLIADIRAETARLLNGYIRTDQLLHDMHNFIVMPKLYPISGLVGSYLLGKKALQESRESVTKL